MCDMRTTDEHVAAPRSCEKPRKAVASMIWTDEDIDRAVNLLNHGCGQPNLADAVRNLREELEQLRGECERYADALHAAEVRKL